MTETYRLPLAEVVVAGPMRLRPTWTDGASVDVDLAAAIVGDAILGPLEDPALFAQARIGPERFTVEWPGNDDLELGADQLWRWGMEQAGRIMPHAEFLAWLARTGLSVSEAADALGISRRMATYYKSGAWPIPRTVHLATIGWEASRQPRSAA